MLLVGLFTVNLYFGGNNDIQNGKQTTHFIDGLLQEKVIKIKLTKRGVCC